MPTRGSPNQHFRVDNERWQHFGEQVAQLPYPSTRSAVLRQLIAWFNREPGAHLPQRPTPEHPAPDADDHA